MKHNTCEHPLTTSDLRRMGWVGPEFPLLVPGPNPFPQCLGD